MNLNLESISNSVSAPPAATFVGQAASSLGGPKGFGATLAAARGLATAPQTVAGEVDSAGGLAGDAGSATALNGRVPASGNPSLKKLLSVPLNVPLNIPLNPSPNPNSASMVTAEVIPAMVGQIPLGPAQTSVVQTSVARMNLAQPMLMPALTRVQEGQVPKGAVGIVASGGQTTATYNATAQSARISDSGPSRTAGIFGSLASSDGTAGNLKSLSTAGVSVPDVGVQANRQEISMANSVEPAVLPNALPDSAPGIQGNEPPHELASAGAAVLAECAPTPANAAGSSVSSTLSLVGMRDGPAGAFVPGGAGSWSAEPALRADQAVELTGPAPTLLANAETQPAVEVVLASADLQTSGANQANEIAPDTGVQSDVAVRTGTENPISAIMNSNGPISTSTSTKLNPPAMGFPVPTRADAVTSPSARGVGQGTGARSSILSSLTAVLPTGSDSGDGSAIASQTPFSVFFSSPGSGGPGTESAASTLPKMILQGASSAIRDSHMGGANESSASAPTSGLSSGAPSGNSPSGTSQNSAPSNSKDSSTGTEGGSLQTARRDAELSAASGQFSATQTGAAPAPAPPTGTVVTLPLGPAAPVADPLPKAGTLPGAAPASATSTVPASAETPVVAAPGPVQLAQMINRVEQSEMRIGMNTSAFGSVEVRAVVHSSDVGLVIGSEKGDLRSLLANDMPAITNTLQQQSLRLNSVNFMQGFAFSNNASGGGDSQHRSFVPQRGFVSSASEAAVDDSMEPLPAGEFGGGSSSLSILA